MISGKPQGINTLVAVLGKCAQVWVCGAEMREIGQVQGGEMCIVQVQEPFILGRNLGCADKLKTPMIHLLDS